MAKVALLALIFGILVSLKQFYGTLTACVQCVYFGKGSLNIQMIFK